MKIPIFRKGNWMEYEVPREVPPGWKPSHNYMAASVFATAHALGNNPKESAALAEMYVFKQIFEGLVYDSKFESKLTMILNHEEITSDPTKSRKREPCEEKSQEE